MNTVAIMGRITKDIELREVGKGKDAFSACSFTLAVNRNKEVTDWIRCEAVGSTAELIDSYFSKGDMLAVTGEIRTGSYEDKDGETRYTWCVHVNKISFPGSSKGKQEAEEEEEEKPRRRGRR